jgi:hypothetical protein
MANICENKFHIYCDSESVIEKIVGKLDTLFEDTLDGEISYASDSTIEGYFDSRWAFPEDVFEDFFEEFNDDSIYMRCLSEEYVCGLVSMNIYVDGQWKEPQCFDLY